MAKLPFAFVGAKAPTCTTCLAWLSERFPEYPLELTLDFLEVVEGQAIQLTFHEQRRPRGILLFKGQHLSAMEEAISLPYQASYKVDCHGQQFLFLRLVCDRPANPLNAYDQIQVSRLVVYGKAVKASNEKAGPALHRRLKRANYALDCSRERCDKSLHRNRFQQALPQLRARARLKSSLNNYQSTLDSRASPNLSTDLSLAESRLQDQLTQHEGKPRQVRFRIKKRQEKSLKALRQYFERQGMLERRHLALMDEQTVDSKLALLAILVQKITSPKHRRLTETEHRMLSSIFTKLLSIASLPPHLLLTHTLKVLSLYLSKHRPPSKTSLCKALLSKLPVQQLQDQVIGLLSELYQHEFEEVLEVLFGMVEESDQDGLFDIARLAIVIREKGGCEQLMLAPIKLALLSHPSRRVRYELNLLFNKAGRVCEFCGLEDDQFKAKSDYIDHLRNRCLMLIQCYLCQRVVEIQEMDDHLTSHSVTTLRQHCFYCQAGPLPTRKHWLTHLPSCPSCPRGTPLAAP